jgi:acid phosphatase
LIIPSKHQGWEIAAMPRQAITFCTLTLAAVAMACSNDSSMSGGGNGNGTGGGGTLPAFGHVVIVLEENHNSDQVDSTSMPYLHSLLPQGAFASQDYANTHPSIGNYFWLTTGQLITNSDGYSATVTDDNIVRHLLAAGKTWKGYAEDLPSVGFTGQTSGGYARKHFPLSFFSDVVNDSNQLKRLVPFTQFATDLAGDSLPSYSFITPNLCNDAHDCSLQTADTWLQTNIAPLLSNPAFQADGLLIITFDESDNDDTHGGGRIFWLALGPKVKQGFVSTTVYQHENTLRLMAEGLGLTSFPGAAASASNMSEFFTP